ncbi:hypothetical protein IMSAGC005_03188 [Lachnospiraceae bacterium]|nr:hypothetical protein IMSAGC005_03188 [Lachnospiraceae bacterium]
MAVVSQIVSASSINRNSGAGTQTAGTLRPILNYDIHNLHVILYGSKTGDGGCNLKFV